MRRVQQSTWNWRVQKDASADKTRRRAQLWRQAMIQSAMMVAIALGLAIGLGHRTVAAIVACLAAAFLLLGLFVPAAYARVHHFGTVLGHIVGKVLLHVLMVPFFLLFMTPAALYLRLRGRDPLHRRFRSPEHTYWIPRLKRPRGENIDKQFLRESREARSALRPVGAVGWDGREDGA